MHICHVITRLIIGGAQENTLLTCRGLVDRGHRVTLIAGSETGPEGSLWDTATEWGFELIQLPSMRRAVNPISDWRACADLGKIFRRIRPDVVHTHSSKAGILGRAAAARAAVPVIIHTIHGMSFNRTQSALVRVLYRWLELRAARRTSAFAVVADAMTRQAVAAGLGPADRFTTIRSGMETQRFSPDPEARARSRQDWSVAEDDIVVGTIARLFENKGYEEIIQAMPSAVKRQPRLRFVWIGDGAHAGLYRKRLAEMGMDRRVHFAGLIHPDDVAQRINGFDILLHASRWEGLPRAVVQALLTEVPAVSFDNDGAPEVVIPDQTGVLVPLGDTQRLADAIVLLAGDAELRRTFGRNGRLRCLEMFDWRNMVVQLEELYRRLAPEPGDSSKTTS